jgi:hypothetical protein
LIGVGLPVSYLCAICNRPNGYKAISTAAIEQIARNYQRMDAAGVKSDGAGQRSVSIVIDSNARGFSPNNDEIRGECQ